MQSNETNIVLEATGIRKAYHNPKRVLVLDGVSLTLHQGDTVAIIGRSGEGKSTLLQILGTLESQCEGSLAIKGQDTSKCSKDTIRNAHIGFVFQSFHLLANHTAIENVLMPAQIGRKNTSVGSEAYTRALALLEKVGLADRAHFHTKLLSGGEKQRVAIARALCNDPEILFADEPSGNLDNQTSRHIHQLLLEFSTEHKKTFVVATHDERLAKLCKYVFRLQDGKLHPVILT